MPSGMVSDESAIKIQSVGRPLLNLSSDDWVSASKKSGEVTFVNPMGSSEIITSALHIPPLASGPYD